MSSLRSLVRGRGVRRGGGYRPFTQPPYRGSYPLAPRGFITSTNRLSSDVSSGIFSSRLRAPQLNLSLYEDRRLWHPSGASAWPRSLVEKYPRVTDRSTIRYKSQPLPWRWGVPYDPNTGEIHRLAPSKVDPSGWTYLPDRPGVLEKARALKGYGFENPWKVIICLKRKMRREIMNALGYAGKTGFKKPRYTQYSYVRCY